MDLSLLRAAVYGHTGQVAPTAQVLVDPRRATSQAPPQPLTEEHLRGNPAIPNRCRQALRRRVELRERRLRGGRRRETKSSGQQNNVNVELQRIFGRDNDNSG